MKRDLTTVVKETDHDLWHYNQRRVLRRVLSYHTGLLYSGWTPEQPPHTCHHDSRVGNRFYNQIRNRND